MNRTPTRPQNSTKKKARKHRPFSQTLKNTAFLVLLGYSVVTFVSQQAKLEENRETLTRLTEQLEEARQLNDEYTRLLNSDNEAEYMERIAIEKLGYAYPSERRFYAMSGNP